MDFSWDGKTSIEISKSGYNDTYKVGNKTLSDRDSVIEVTTTKGLNVSGLGGHDKIIGNAGKHILFGGDGDDFLIGNGDDDNLDGGAGNDKIDGGAGGDKMKGGTGNDLFLINSAAEHVFSTRISQMRTLPGEVRARFRYIVQRNRRRERGWRWMVRRVKQTVPLSGSPSTIASN